LTDLSVITFTLGSLPNSGPVFIREDEALEIRISVGEEVPTWYELLPKPLDYDNTEVCAPRSGPDCSVNIEWYWKEIPEWSGKHSVLFKDHTPQFELGTHRFTVVSGELPSPDPENTLEIVVRRDDTYVGYATELIGVPFVFWPKSVSGGHQTDLRLGADCAATVTYGKRRSGHQVGYFAPKGLLRYLVEVEPTSIQVGDVLHFGFQTALLSQDTEPIGTLNDSDMIIHSYHHLVEEIPFNQATYAPQSFKVYRWMDVFQ
jgi:hypothetical protein